MAELADRLPEIWAKLVELPVSFWCLNALICMVVAFLACVFWTLPPRFLVLNKKAFFDYNPILWISFQFFGLTIATEEKLFMIIGSIVFAFYGYIVHINQTIRPD